MADGKFKSGHKKLAGRPKGAKNKTTLWVLESLKKHGVDYEKLLADALRDRDFEMLDRLAKLAPHIANKPKESVGLEGIEDLVIERYKDKPPEEKEKPKPE